MKLTEAERVENVTEHRLQSAALKSTEVHLYAVPESIRERASWRFSSRGVAVRLFLTCWLIFGLHFATNTVREIYPALSLGDHLSFNVSEYVGLHPDIFEIPGRGAFINSNPGASIVGAIPYSVFRPVIDRVVERTQRARATNPTSQGGEYQSPYPMAQEFYRVARERGYDIKFGLASAVMQLFAMAPISALSAVVMFYIFLGLKLPVRSALFLALLYAFATPIFYRTAQLNQNLLVSHCALFAFALLWRPWDEGNRKGSPKYLLAGLLSGFAVVLDYSGIVVPLVIGAYALAKSRVTDGNSRNKILRFVAGVTVCAVVLMAYQWACFGHPLFPAQRYMPATQFSHFGYNGMDRPHLDLLGQTAFGIRFGLFTSAPLLLLAFWVPGWLKRDKRLVGNLETIFIFAFTVLFFLFTAANQFGRLQFNTGVRYIVPVVPFLFLLVAGILLRLPKVVAVIVGIVTTYWSWCLAMYRDVELGLGVLEPVKRVTLQGFRLPWLTTIERMGYLAGGVSVIPLFVICAAILWALWSVGQQKSQRAQTIQPVE